MIPHVICSKTWMKLGGWILTMIYIKMLIICRSLFSINLGLRRGLSESYDEVQHKSSGEHNQNIRCSMVLQQTFIHNGISWTHLVLVPVKNEHKFRTQIVVISHLMPRSPSPCHPSDASARAQRQRLWSKWTRCQSGQTMRSLGSLPKIGQWEFTQNRRIELI